jgi:hypothetical protein
VVDKLMIGFLFILLLGAGIPFLAMTWMLFIHTLTVGFTCR